MKPKTKVRLRKGMEDWRMERKCSRSTCQKPFIPIREKQVHCSPECRREAWNERRRMKDVAENPFGLIQREGEETMLKYLKRLEKEASQQMRLAAREQEYFRAAYWKAVRQYASEASRYFGKDAAMQTPL
jgi:hypothetical protein